MTLATFFSSIRATLFHPLSQDQVDGVEALLEASEGLPISWRAYLMGTAYLETARTMQPIYERGSRSYFDKYEPGTKIGKELGNTKKGDGYLFRGAGYVQMTGRANFARASTKIGVDLIAHPELALRPDLAAKIAVIGMTEGWFTGRKFADYLPGDYVGARRIINRQDRAQEIASFASRFESALATL